MYSLEVRKMAVAAVLAGASAREAAGSLGVGHTAVTLWCRAAGVPLCRGRNGGQVTRVDASAAPPRARTSPR